jgi:hypothetical protein
MMISKMKDLFNLDLIDEVREKAETRMKRYQMNMAQLRHMMISKMKDLFNLDLIDKVQEKAETRMKRYQKNMAGHIHLISLHSRFCFFSDFVNQIEVEADLSFVLMIVICRSSKGRQAYFDWNNCFTPIRHSKWDFSCRDSYHHSVCPQGAREFFWP